MKTLITVTIATYHYTCTNLPVSIYLKNKDMSGSRFHLLLCRNNPQIPFYLLIHNTLECQDFLMEHSLFCEMMKSATKKFIISRKSLKIPKSINRRRTNNTKAKKKMYKRANNDLQNITHKTKD